MAIIMTSEPGSIDLTVDTLVLGEDGSEELLAAKFCVLPQFNGLALVIGSHVVRVAWFAEVNTMHAPDFPRLDWQVPHRLRELARRFDSSVVERMLVLHLGLDRAENVFKSFIYDARQDFESQVEEPGSFIFPRPEFDDDYDPKDPFPYDLMEVQYSHDLQQAKEARVGVGGEVIRITMTAEPEWQITIRRAKRFKSYADSYAAISKKHARRQQKSDIK